MNHMFALRTCCCFVNDMLPAWLMLCPAQLANNRKAESQSQSITECVTCCRLSKMQKDITEAEDHCKRLEKVG